MIERAACSRSNPPVAAIATVVVRIDNASHNSRNRRSRLRRLFSPLLTAMTILVTFTGHPAMSKNRAEG
jgi:hypothetical protein